MSLTFKKSYLVILGIALTLITGCLPTDTPLDASMFESNKGEIENESGVGEFKGLVSVETQSATKVKLTWTATTDTRVVAYNIYDTTLMFSPRLIKTVKAPMDNATITSLTPQTYYSFRVRAVDGSQKEDANVADKGAIPYGGAVTATIIDASSADISINPANDVDAVLIYCREGITATTDTLQSRTVNIGNETKVRISNLTQGIQYSCRAAVEVGGFEDNNSVYVQFIPLGTATQLSFLTQPSNANAGDVLSGQPVIAIKDANGNTITAGPDSTALVTLTISASSPTTGNLRGTAAVNAIAGVATFSGLSVNEAGIKIIEAVKEDTSGVTLGSGPLLKTSNNFTIVAGAVNAANSTIAISPSVPPSNPLVADGTAGYTVTITLKDQFGNAITGVKPQFGTSKAGDSLTQPSTFTDATGKTTGVISTLIADEDAPYRQLSITSPSGLSSVTTLAPFVAGSANKLAFTVQPVNSPAGVDRLNDLKVAIQDVNGNVVKNGTDSSAAITLNITNNLNGALLTGTATVNAVSGVATFTDLGIDRTGTGYKFIANSGSFVTALSNSFNVIAGTPQKLVIAGANSVISGSCSAAITFQLQDNGGNAANALANTSVIISGLGSASLYTSSSCGGSALTGAPNNVTLTFTAGTNIKTLYLKDLKGESIDLNVRDSSNVLTTGTKTFYVNPNKITLSAPASVLSGACSPALNIVPRGDDGGAAPLFVSGTLAIAPMGATAKLYSDSGCTQQIVASSFTVNATSGLASTTIQVYAKNNKAETLSINVADPSGVMTTTSMVQSMEFTASHIGFTGPSSVVAGRCSSAYTITLVDANGDPVVASANTALNIAGLAGTSGKFYSNSACTTGMTQSSATIPQGSSGIVLYFSDLKSEVLNVKFQNTALGLADSPVINILISPSKFNIKVVSGNAASVNTSACSEELAVVAMDGDSPASPTSATATLVASLSTTGYGASFTTAGKFYADSTCATQINSVTIPVNQTEARMYFKGQYPSTSLSLVASDTAGVLTNGTLAFTVVAKKSWIGTLGRILDDAGNLLWFRTGVKPVAARMDAPASVRSLYFDANKQYLYVVDERMHRVLKYDYVNHRYVGWIGYFQNAANAAASVKGSNKALYPDVPSSASCIATAHAEAVPGWCVGGQSTAVSNPTQGGMYSPKQVTDDGTYLYVTNYSGYNVARFNIATGAFDGWIGRISATPTGLGTGAPTTCTTTSSGYTPGWCKGGTQTVNGGSSAWSAGDGSIYEPGAITNDGTYLYVGVRGAVLRIVMATGAYAGWIGLVYDASPTGGVAGCSGASLLTQTPGWCTGGTFRTTTTNAQTIAGAMSWPTSLKVKSGILYVVDNAYSGNINKYNATTGAFIGNFTDLAHNWQGAGQLVEDPVTNNFLVADNTRILAIDNSVGTVYGWLGKVSNPPSSASLGHTNNSACSNLTANSNTPGWCLGGLAKRGMDEQAFVGAYAITHDGSGNFLVGQYEVPAIKIFNASTGAYGGSLVFSSESSTEWTNDATTFAELNGNADHDFFNPMGSYSDGTYLYVVDSYNARVKKINLADGSLVGWIGGMTTAATSGVTTACAAANPMSFTPTWCKGALPNPWYYNGNFMGNTVDGLMYIPHGVVGDGTYLYVTDAGYNRILKYNAATGAYIGWIGAIGSSPTGGATGCNGAAVGTFTPGWCLGGTPTNGTGDGMMYEPAAITYVASTGKIYVVENSNHRVSSFNASTGSFAGWIGRTNATPTGGCTPASNGSVTVSNTGWCTGGTSQLSSGDRGGGFYFWTGAMAMNGITTDGTYLYVNNYYNYRIDKFNLTGVWLGSVKTRADQLTNVWTGNTTTDRTTVSGWSTGGCGKARGLWISGNDLYGVIDQDCAYANYSGVGVFKMDVSTGNMVGWQGGINPISPSYSPTAGDAGCVGAAVSTPGWCRGGASIQGFKLGQFGDARNVTGDANFIYVTDVTTSRVTRLPR